MDEYYDYSKLTYNPEVDRKWTKFLKLMQNDPGSQIVLISVPKGFAVENLNTTNLDLKKKISQAKKSDGAVITKGTV